MSTAQQRRARLLDAIRQEPHEVRTGEVMALYRAHGWGPSRTTARRDLQYLARHGQLAEHGSEDDRFYTLTWKDGCA
ncbi:DeoR family transcriptional regulator [Streptomyces sp. NPDC017086]|uniref:DeoR family transcriptional regulator n=1 Tax=Streptomyces sp. NPDC017086 TaxID=3364976 RepID=UPI003791093B